MTDLKTLLTADTVLISGDSCELSAGDKKRLLAYAKALVEGTVCDSVIEDLHARSRATDLQTLLVENTVMVGAHELTTQDKMDLLYWALVQRGSELLRRGREIHQSLINLEKQQIAQ
jgi:hypothetical protein